MTIEIERIGKNDQWPEAVSDGLSLSCSLCKHQVKFDYRVSDTAWETLVPIKYRRNVICLPCLDNMATRKGVDIIQDIKQIQFTGIKKTVVFDPTKIIYYEK